MKEKIGLSTLIASHLGDNFEVAQRLLDIRIEANSIAELAQKRVDEDGDLAHMYAESIGNWLANITSVAELALAKVIEVNEGKGLNR
jgi:hypothetical protein